METADLTHHISRRFNEDLEKVRNQVLQMGGFVEQQLHKAITALVEGDSRLGESVATDDYKVNGMELSIDEECSRILAIRAPLQADGRACRWTRRTPAGAPTNLPSPGPHQGRARAAPGGGREGGPVPPSR